jgi:hypothetical protein
MGGSSPSGGKKKVKVKNPTSHYVSKPRPKDTTKEKASVTAKEVIRKQTRKAYSNRSQMVQPTNKGLGITKNEGGKTLQNAVKTLGYKKAKGVVMRTLKNQSQKSTPSRGKKRA